MIYTVRIVFELNYLTEGLLKEYFDQFPEFK